MQEIDARELESGLVRLDPPQDIAGMVKKRFDQSDYQFEGAMLSLIQQQYSQIIRETLLVDRSLLEARRNQDTCLQQWSQHWIMFRRYIERGIPYPITDGKFQGVPPPPMTSPGYMTSQGYAVYHCSPHLLAGNPDLSGGQNPPRLQDLKSVVMPNTEALAMWNRALVSFKLSEERINTYNAANKPVAAKLRRDVKRHLSQITNVPDVIINKSKALDALQTELEPNGKRYYACLLARDIVAKARASIRKDGNNAYAFAYTIVLLSTRIPGFFQNVYGFMAQGCPQIVPHYTDPKQCESLDEYYVRIGFQSVPSVVKDQTNNDLYTWGETITFEGKEVYLKRVGSTMQLYGAIVQHGWRWLARTANITPQLGTATAVKRFLEAAAYKMECIYQPQFRKLLTFLAGEKSRKNLPQGDEFEQYEANALRNQLEDILRNGLEKPAGMDLGNLASSNVDVVAAGSSF